LSRASILLVGVATLAVAIPVLALPGQTERWEPVLTVEQAVAMPNLGTAGGRSSIVSADGSVGWLCSARMGVLPEIVPCWATRWAVLPNALFLVPLLVLAWRAARAPPAGEAWPGDLIYLWALVAGVAWWAVATLFAFKLHLPARYPQRVLSILEWLAIGQMLGNWLSARLGTKSASTGPKVAAGTLGLLLLISFATPTPGIRRPSDPDALRAIAALPPDAVVAGLSADLDFVPALAGRSTLATVEHAIPYHWGYFGEIDRRLRATVAAAATPNPEDLAAFIRRERVSAFVIDQAALEQGQVPVSYAGVVHAAVQQANAELRRQPSALQRLAPACTLHRGKVLVLDGPCLAGRPARGEASRLTTYAH
jgi:hypothetical protein